MDQPSITIKATDIDIDTPDREVLLKLFKHTPAMITRRNRQIKHNTGVYFHQVPKNPYTGLCNIDYEKAEELGFFKLDILNLSVYKDVVDDNHLNKLTNTEPLWELLWNKDFCDMLFQLNGHHGICKQMKPKSIEQLAAVLAMIRPSKNHLIGKDWDTIFSQVWVPPTDGSYYFKKAHSISYALTVVVHMNIICEPFR